MQVRSLLTVKSIRWLAASNLILLLASCGPSPAEVSVDSAWVRTPLPSKTTTSAYVQFKNHTKESITLISAESETIGAIEFHKSELKDGMHRMIRLDTLEIPAKDTLILEPGGLHLMLFRVQDVEDNKHVVNFHTESDLEVEVTFEIHEEEPD